jgi:hypothetical protein
MPVERSQLLIFLRDSSLFRDLEDEQLDMVISRLEIVPKEDGEGIFKQGDESGALYFIFSGNVNITRWTLNREAPYMNLGPGDLLGYEIFGRGETRKVSARASGPTVLLTLNFASLASLIKQIPVLYNRLKIRVDSYHLALQVKLSWRKPEEVIFFIGRRHPFFLARRFIGPFAVGFVALIVFSLLILNNANLANLVLPAIAVGVFFVGYCIWEYIDWTNDYSIITNRRVNFQEKIIFLYDSRIEALLTAIRSVETYVDRIGLMLGYGSVIVHTFAGDVVLEHIYFVKDVAAMLEEQRRRALTTLAKEDIQAFKKTIRQRMEEGVQAPTVQTVLRPPPSRAKPKKPVYLKTRRANFMNMRFEEGGNVTYRTHVFILFARIWFPLVMLIVLLALLIAGVLSGSTVMTNPTGRSIWLSAAGILTLIALGVTVYRAEDWRNDIYVITNDQLIDRNKKPLGREDVRTANLANIEAIRFEQKGLWALMFNFGTVFVRVGLQELPFSNIYNPSEVQRELFRRIAERENRRQQEAMRIERERVADWIGAYYEVASEKDEEKENPTAPENPPPAPPPTETDYPDYPDFPGY